MANIFTAPDSASQQMADTLPRGRAWGHKNTDGSNTRLLIDSLAVAHNRVQQQVELLDTEFRIENAVALLPDWETSVGLPDECFDVSGSLEIRRQAVIDRLRKTPLVKLADFQSFVDRLYPDLNITLKPAFLEFELEYELEATLTGAFDTTFYLIATIPVITESLEVDLEMEIGVGVDVNQFICLMNKIMPANTILLIDFLEV
jgi:uncharacterized protein YmfQ (DUF2313 family)